MSYRFRWLVASGARAIRLPLASPLLGGRGGLALSLGTRQYFRRRGPLQLIDRWKLAPSSVWFCTNQPKGFEKYFKKKGENPDPESTPSKSNDAQEAKDSQSDGTGGGTGGGGGSNKRGGRRGDSLWWKRMQKGEFPWDDKDFRYLAVLVAGIASGFLYLYFRDNGKEITWKDFVHYYLARGLEMMAPSKISDSEPYSCEERGRTTTVEGLSIHCGHYKGTNFGMCPVDSWEL